MDKGVLQFIDVLGRFVSLNARRVSFSNYFGQLISVEHLVGHVDTGRPWLILTSYELSVEMEYCRLRGWIGGWVAGWLGGWVVGREWPHSFSHPSARAP